MIDQQILDESITYILEHLEENLTVEDVAAHFHYSEYYFNREFRKKTGESVYAFIKRQRLNQSAMEMKVDREQNITDISGKYGYSSSNFSTAFKKVKNVSPEAFRKCANQPSSNNPFDHQKVDHFDTYEDLDSKISIQCIDDIECYYERYIGNYNDLKQVWYQFMDVHATELAADPTMIERFYDDPQVVEVNQCICDLCLPIHKNASTIDSKIDSKIDSNINSQIGSQTTIKGGRFAVYLYHGKIGEIYRTLQGIFTIWLPNSPYRMDGRTGINIYRAVDREHDIVTMDLYIPIQ